MYYVYMGSVLLPIAPEKITLEIKNQNKTMVLINDGEINFLKDAGLSEFEFDVLIPAVKYSFAKYDGEFKSPTYFTNHFEQLKLSKKPFQFVVSRKMPSGKFLFDTNMTVSLESYTIKEDANQGFDLVISIKLKQYKPFGTKIIKISKPEPEPTKPIESPAATVTPPREEEKSPEPKQDTTYTVQRGDTLGNIAKKFYGSSSKYTVIFEANRDKISNPNLIYVGQVLVIPKL